LAWQINFDKAAEKDLAKLDYSAVKRIVTFLRERIAALDDPRSIGEVLKGTKLGDFWKYRVGDYRVIARIEDSEVIIIIVRVGNRKEVYR
jgi:mRNA interferase RelE/StbE